MTSDRARKKAARAQQAATGQPYTRARRAVQPDPGSPAELVEPPPIDPGEHAMHTQTWGDLTFHLVRYRGRYYTWSTDLSASGRPIVQHVPSEEVGRRLVDKWQAENILRASWADTIEHFYLADPSTEGQICYQTALAEVESQGLWLACWDQTVAGESSYVLAQFAELEPGLEAFAARAEAAADQAERNPTLSLPDVLAGVLRSRAAQTRAEIARARLGDALRARQGQVEGDRRLSRVLGPAGLDVEGLGPVLDGREFAWPARPVVRPPGSRRPDTPVTRLAEYTVEGQTFTLICYVDSAGARCVAVEHEGHPSVIKDVAVNEDRLVSQGSSMPWRRGGPAVIYGRAHDSVTALYSIAADGQRKDWAVHDDPGTGERYFAVVVVPETLADIVAEAPGRRVSLKGSFGMWFNPPGSRPRYTAEAADGS